MLCFGIDPGSQKTGFGVVRIIGSRIEFIDAGVIRTEAGTPLPVRLVEIFSALEAKLALHTPEVVVIESIFHHESAKSALVLGHARGVALLAAERAGAATLELSPAEIKKAVSGSGRADKHQMKEMVRVLLGLPKAPASDAADALAAAIAGSARARSPMLRAQPARRSPT